MRRRTRTLLVGIGLALLVPGARAPQPATQEPSDLARIHATESAHEQIREDTFASVFRAAGNGYERMSRGEGGPTIPLFSWLTALAEYYDSELQRASAALTREEQELATRISDRLFGGLFGGYHDKLDPLGEASVADFHDRRRLRASAELWTAAQDERVRSAAHQHLLAHVASLEAWNVLQALTVSGGAILGSRQFREAYDHYTVYGERFGFMTELFGLVKGRYKFKLIEMLAETSVPDRQAGKVRENPFAAQGYLMTADMELRAAHDRFKIANLFGLENFVYDAIRHVADARSFGATRRSLRQMLAGHREAMTATDTRTTETGEKAFGTLVADAIGDHQRGAERKGSVEAQDYTVADDPVVRPQERKGVLEEQVDVTAEKRPLNYSLFLYDEVELLVREAKGERTLEGTVALARNGKLLFQGMLREAIRASSYAHLGAVFDEAMRVQGDSPAIRFASERFDLPPPAIVDLAESLAAAGRVRGDRKARMTAFGSRLFTLPQVRRAFAGGRSDRVREPLRVVDPPERYLDIADMLNAQAAARAADPRLAPLIEALDARVNAVYAFLQAAGRYADQTGAQEATARAEVSPVPLEAALEIPSSVHLALGGTAFNVYALLSKAIDAKNEAGLVTEEDVVRHLGGDAAAREATARLAAYHAHAGDFLALARRAFLALRDRPTMQRARPEVRNAAYRDHLESLAGLALVNRNRAALLAAAAGRERARADSGGEAARAEIKASLERLLQATPVDGRQHFIRGTILADRLGLAEPARDDLCRAFVLLTQEGDALARRAYDKAIELGRACDTLAAD